MSFWSENLMRAEIGGIEIPVGERSVGGGRAFAAIRYPFRDGQDTEDTGREPLSFDLEIPLFRSIDPAHYPDLKEQLEALFDDPISKGEVEYQDPEKGIIPCKVVRWRWRTNPSQVDGGIFSLSLEERTFEPFIFAMGRDTDPTGSATLEADSVDDALEAAGVDDETAIEAMSAAGFPLSADVQRDLEAGAIVGGLVTRFLGELDSGELDATELASRVDILSGRLDALTRLEAIEIEGAFELLGAVSRLIVSVQTIGEEAVRTATPLVIYMPTATLSAWEIAAALYGTPDRASEIMRRNPTANPLFYPAGVALVVLAS